MIHLISVVSLFCDRSHPGNDVNEILSDLVIIGLIIKDLKKGDSVFIWWSILLTLSTGANLWKKSRTSNWHERTQIQLRWTCRRWVKNLSFKDIVPDVYSMETWQDTVGREQNIIRTATQTGGQNKEKGKRTPTTGIQSDGVTVGMQVRVRTRLRINQCKIQCHHRLFKISRVPLKQTAFKCWVDWWSVRRLVMTRDRKTIRSRGRVVMTVRFRARQRTVAQFGIPIDYRKTCRGWHVIWTKHWRKLSHYLKRQSDTEETVGFSQEFTWTLENARHNNWIKNWRLSKLTDCHLSWCSIWNKSWTHDKLTGRGMESTMEDRSDRWCSTHLAWSWHCDVQNCNVSHWSSDTRKQSASGHGNWTAALNCWQVCCLRRMSTFTGVQRWRRQVADHLHQQREARRPLMTVKSITHHRQRDCYGLDRPFANKLDIDRLISLENSSNGWELPVGYVPFFSFESPLSRSFWSFPSQTNVNDMICRFVM